MAVDVQVEALDSIRRRLVVQIPAQAISDELETTVREFARTAKIPGFRPGRVPRQVVERRFGDRLRADVVDRLLRNSLAEALQQEQIAPLGPPEVVTEADEPQQGLRFAATVEVKPHVEARDYRGIHVERPIAPVTDGDVDAVLERWRESAAQLLPIDGRDTAEMGDVAVIDLVAKADGKVVGSSDGRPLAIGDSGVPSPFDESLVGMAVGSERTIRVDYPTDHDDERFAGRTVEFQVKLHGLSTRSVPTLDDDFAKDHGESDTLAELRAKVRTRLEAEARRRGDAEARRSLLAELARRNDIDLPRSMVEQRLESMVDEVRQEWKQRRLWPPNESDLVERLRAEFDPQAREQVKVALVLEAIVRQEGIQVDDPEMDERLAALAAQADAPREQVEAFYRRPEVRAEMRARLLHAKAVDFVLGVADVVDVQKEANVADDSESN